jgi:hypothetical protein
VDGTCATPYPVTNNGLQREGGKHMYMWVVIVSLVTSVQASAAIRKHLTLGSIA